ncbi:17061_t:CDS:1, partial [Funneliformis caledonium]
SLGEIIDNSLEEGNTVEVPNEVAMVDDEWGPASEASEIINTI